MEKGITAKDSFTEDVNGKEEKWEKDVEYITSREWCHRRWLMQPW
jgi:hypothetical protein